MHDTLRDRVRDRDGRDPQPSAVVLDSRSVTSSEGGEAIGYDAGERVRGRKRHLLVDACARLAGEDIEPHGSFETKAAAALPTTSRPTSRSHPNIL